MSHTDETLMGLVHELIHKIHRQHMGGPGGRRHLTCRERFPERGEGRCHHRHCMEEGNRPERGGLPTHRPPMARERILRMIEVEGPISQNKLASQLAIRPQSISELLAKLEGDGFIIRTKNEQDKRETLVSLTEMGKARSKEVETARAQHAASFFNPLTQEEKEALAAILRKLISQEDDGQRTESTGDSL